MSYRTNDPIGGDLSGTIKNAIVANVNGVPIPGGVQAVANVRVYGAKGDDTTDDTTAFQAAINASTGVGIAYVPPGTYRINSTLLISGYQSLHLDTNATLHRHSGGSNTPIVRMTGRNCSLKGYGTIQADLPIAGIIYVGPSSHSSPENIELWHVETIDVFGSQTTGSGDGSIAIFVDSSEGYGGGGNNYQGTIERVKIQDVDEGIRFGSACNAHTVIAPMGNAIGSHFIRFYALDGYLQSSENSVFGGFLSGSSFASSTIECNNAGYALIFGLQSEPGGSCKYYNIDGYSEYIQIYGHSNCVPASTNAGINCTIFVNGAANTDTGSGNAILGNGSLKPPLMVFESGKFIQTAQFGNSNLYHQFGSQSGLGGVWLGNVTPDTVGGTNIALAGDGITTTILNTPSITASQVGSLRAANNNIATWGQQVTGGHYGLALNNPNNNFIWMTGSNSTSTTNYSLFGDGTTTTGINAPSSGNITFSVGTSGYASIGQQVSGYYGLALNNTNNNFIWLGNGASPSASNYSLFSDATTSVVINAPSSGTGYLRVGGTSVANWIQLSSTQGGIQLPAIGVGSVGYLWGAGTPSTNNFALGLDTADTVINVPSGGTIRTRVNNGSDLLTITSTLITTSQPLAFGTNPATTGEIRLPNNTGIYARNSANSGDLSLIASDSSNNILIGGLSNVNDVNIYCGVSQQMNIDPTNGVKIYNNIYPSADALYTLGTVGTSGWSALYMSGNVTFSKSTNSPTISQNPPTTDVTTTNLTLQSQAPFASATTNKTPGNIVLNCPTPISGGNYGVVNFEQGGSSIAQISYYNNNNASSAVYLGPSTSVGASNYCLRSDGSSYLVVNSPGSGSFLSLRVNNTEIVNVTASTATLTQPLQFSAGLSSPSITQSTQTSDVATSNLTITSQAPYSSATTNKTPGSVIINIPSPISGGNEGSFQVQRGGVIQFQTGRGTPLGGSPGAMLWMTSSPSNTNFLVTTDGSTFVGLNAPTSSSTLYTELGDTIVFGLSSANGMQYNALFASPGMNQAAQISDAAPNNMVIQSQGPYPAASTHTSPGNIVLNTPAAVGSGIAGNVFIQTGGTSYGAFGLYNNTANTGALWLGSSAVSPTNANFTIYNNGGGATVVNGAAQIFFDIGGGAEASITSSAFTITPPIGGNSVAFSYASAAPPLTSGIANTLTNAQYDCPQLNFTGTLSGSGTSIVFPATNGAFWICDFSAITFGGHSLTLSANSQTWGTTVSAGNVYLIYYSSSIGKLIGVQLTA